jgi:hypothetical protein
MQLPFTPSFYSHLLNGLFVSILLLFIGYHAKQIFQFDVYRLSMLLSSMSIAIGIHSISHLGLEVVYGYNPLKMNLKID